MTKKEYIQEMERVRRENIQKLYKQSIKQERKKYSYKPNVETSKLISFYLFALLNAIVVYAMIAMWKFADLSYLGVLISDIAAQVLIYAIYCLKAYKAKKSEENMKFRREQLNGTIENIISSGAESEQSVPLTRGSIDDFTNN